MEGFFTPPGHLANIYAQLSQQKQQMEMINTFNYSMNSGNFYGNSCGGANYAFAGNSLFAGGVLTHAYNPWPIPPHDQQQLSPDNNNPWHQAPSPISVSQFVLPSVTPSPPRSYPDDSPTPEYWHQPPKLQHPPPLFHDHKVDQLVPLHHQHQVPMLDDYQQRMSMTGVPYQQQPPPQQFNFVQINQLQVKQEQLNLLYNCPPPPLHNHQPAPADVNFPPPPPQDHQPAPPEHFVEQQPAVSSPPTSAVPISPIIDDDDVLYDLQFKPVVSGEDANGSIYTCPICVKEFRKPWHLRTHISGVHYKVRPFQCDICPLAFRSPYDLRRHTTTHTGERFSCDKCDSSFGSKQRITRHLKDSPQCWR